MAMSAVHMSKFAALHRQCDVSIWKILEWDEKTKKNYSATENSDEGIVQWAVEPNKTVLHMGLQCLS